MRKNYFNKAVVEDKQVILVAKIVTIHDKIIGWFDYYKTEFWFIKNKQDSRDYEE